MSLRLRPRFDVQVDASPDDVMEMFHSALSDNDTVLGRRFTHQYELYVPPEERHFWSPFLNVLIRETSSGSSVYGQFGPNVNVWTLFVAAYVVLGLCAITGVMIGVSQMTIKQSPTGFGMTAVGVVLALGVYVAGKFGERLAQPQILQIKAFAEIALKRELKID